MRISAGAYFWRKVEGMMGIDADHAQNKVNMLSSCVTPAYMNALETVERTEKQQEKPRFATTTKTIW